MITTCNNLLHTYKHLRNCMDCDEQEDKQQDRRTTSGTDGHEVCWLLSCGVLVHGRGGPSQIGPPKRDDYGNELLFFIFSGVRFS